MLTTHDLTAATQTVDSLPAESSRCHRMSALSNQHSHTFNSHYSVVLKIN